MVPKVLVYYNSKNISFPEWLSLVTLCLVPLIAHIWAEAPRYAILWENPLSLLIIVECIGL